MNNDTSRYLRFLSYALDPEASQPTDLTDISWTELKNFANQHAIVGICWQGLQRLDPLSPNKPTDDDVMAWMALVSKIQKRNRFMDERTEFVARTFLGEGFPNTILKGQGNGRYYPTPSLRTSGDVDIWLHASRKDITRYVQQLCPKERPIYLHIAFTKVKDVEVEVHYMPSYLNNPVCNRRLQRWFAQASSPQEGLFPNTTFNLVYQLCHIMHHIFDEGIGLRQLIDYYYLLKASRQEVAQPLADETLRATLQSFNMLGFARGILWVEHTVLGLPEEYLFAEPDERRGRVILHDVLRGGSFGRFNDDYEHASRRRIYPKRALVKLRHSLSLVRYFPSEALCEPLFRIWHFGWRLF